MRFKICLEACLGAKGGESRLGPEIHQRRVSNLERAFDLVERRARLPEAGVDHGEVDGRDVARGLKVAERFEHLSSLALPAQPTEDQGIGRLRRVEKKARRIRPAADQLHEPELAPGQRRFGTPLENRPQVRFRFVEPASGYQDRAPLHVVERGIGLEGPRFFDLLEALLVAAGRHEHHREPVMGGRIGGVECYRLLEARLRLVKAPFIEVADEPKRRMGLRERRLQTNRFERRLASPGHHLERRFVSVEGE